MGMPLDTWRRTRTPSMLEEGVDALVDDAACMIASRPTTSAAAPPSACTQSGISVAHDDCGFLFTHTQSAMAYTDVTCSERRSRCTCSGVRVISVAVVKVAPVERGSGGSRLNL